MWNREGRFQGHADPPLSRLGRRQAEKLADELEACPPTAVYASDLRRAAQTAEIVAARFGLALETDPGLREVDVGEWSGLTWPEIRARFPEGVERHDARGHGWELGESHEQMAERAIASLRRIADRHGDDRVLVVVHGGTMRALAAHIDGVPVAEHRQRYANPARNCELFMVVLENGVLRRAARESAALGGETKP
jgi:broad specificity phosphatase PhoE